MTVARAKLGQDVLAHLRAGQAIMDLLPNLQEAAARLSHVIDEVEEWSAGELLQQMSDSADLGEDRIH
jgi:hypothetical protein